MPAGPDHYPSMTALYAHEEEGVNYIKEWYRHRWRYKTFENYRKENEIFIMAPHGGGIERGTTELALATAGFTDDFNGQPDTPDSYDYFIFNGTNPDDENGRLHVTSSHYNEPIAGELVQNSFISLAFHGCTDTQPIETTGEGYKACLIGGLDAPFMQILERRLTASGLNAYTTTQKELNGDLPDNIINKNKRHAGTQFELTTSFRKSLYKKNNPQERRTSTNADFWLFVNTIRACIEEYGRQLSV
jgi:phage replication-related protein YjqB (UPF0714/DUF867 family)